MKDNWEPLLWQNFVILKTVSDYRVTAWLELRGVEVLIGKCEDILMGPEVFQQFDNPKKWER
jgi:hypothetical protein